MKFSISIIFLVLLFSVPVFAQIIIDDTDTQLWNETTLEFRIKADKQGKEQVNGVVIGNLRVTDALTNLDITNPADKRIGFGLKIKAKKNLTITPSYIFRQVSALGINAYEHRARLDIVPKKSFQNFSIENRSRFEHRFKTNGRDDDTFYRNRTKLKIPVKSRERTIFTPYVSNDTYFDLQNPQVHRNDTVGGVSKKFTKHFTTEVFYQFRRNFDSRLKKIHVIGFNLKFKVFNKPLFK